MREAFDVLFLDRKAVGFVDIHTGLGERGAGELLCTSPMSHPAYKRAVKWLGDDVRSTSDGSSVSADVRGPMKNALIERLEGPRGPETLIAILIEFWRPANRKNCDTRRVKHQITIATKKDLTCHM